MMTPDTANAVGDGCRPAVRQSPNARRPRRASSYFAFLIEPQFHAGVADFLAGRPLREISKPRDAVNYEYGRLFAAYCTARRIPAPELPRRGQRSIPFLDAERLLFDAWLNEAFPYPDGSLMRRGGR